jgi:Ni/Fe-hydrogenase subunit HybB-like protein
MQNIVNRLKDRSLAIINEKQSRSYWIMLTISLLLIFQGVISIFFTVEYGLDIWGINNKTVWGISICNFIFWIGIAHSGTLISAILLLFKQNWRSSINRAAEAMTLISILCAAVFLLLHTGRPWLAWLWIIPYPNQFNLWVNFKSPLFWDFIAIATYFVVSIIFWYLGMLPDIAFLKQNIKNKFLRGLYKFFGLGWVGSYSQWSGFNKVYTIIAGICTALVISVHSVVSMDFALMNLPGWHSTIFPPYFVVGAIFSGCALVIILLSITRYAYHLEEFIKIEHIEKINKIIFFMSWLVFFSYFIEVFNTLFNTANYEDSIVFIKLKSPIFWIIIVLNCIIPQLLVFKGLRRNIKFSALVAVLITIGMWLERFVIIVMSQRSGILLSEEVTYSPSIFEISIFISTIGLFIFLYMLFLKFIPIVPIWELANEEKAIGNNL